MTGEWFQVARPPSKLRRLSGDVDEVPLGTRQTACPSPSFCMETSRLNPTRERHRDVGFKQKKPAIRKFGTIDCKIIEAQPAMKGIKCIRVPPGEIAIEITHPGRFFRAAVVIFGHPRA